MCAGDVAGPAPTGSSVTSKVAVPKASSRSPAVTRFASAAAARFRPAESASAACHAAAAASATCERERARVGADALDLGELALGMLQPLGELRGGAAILARQALDRGQTLLDALEPLRVGGNRARTRAEP